MIKATATLESISPYSQSRHLTEPKLEKESAKDYEVRTWRERLHVSDDGFVTIPPMAFKNCIAEAAKFLSLQIPGKGKATYTKHFEAGVLVVEGMKLPVKKEEIEGEWLFLPSDGIRGSGKRVDKCYPVVPKWGGDVTFFVIDETITKDIFQYVLEQAGSLVGIGRFRPRNNGFYGRFKLTKLEWVTG